MTKRSAYEDENTTDWENKTNVYFLTLYWSKILNFHDVISLILLLTFSPSKPEPCMVLSFPWSNTPILTYLLNARIIHFFEIVLLFHIDYCILYFQHFTYFPVQ